MCQPDLTMEKKLNANVGVRVEYYNLKLDGYEPDGVKPVICDQSTTDLFPSVNVSYNFNEKASIASGLRTFG